MITVESKLDLFNKVVLEKIKEEEAELIEMLEIKRQEAIKVQKKESTIKADLFLRAIIEEAYDDKKAMLARAKSDMKKQVLSRRQLLVDHLSESVQKRFEAFVVEPSYEYYVSKMIEQHKEDLRGFGSFLVVLDKKNFLRDKEIVEKALKVIGLHTGVYEKSEESLVGGCVVYNESKDTLIDLSLLSLIEDHHKEIGQRMYRMLNEVGERNDK